MRVSWAKNNLISPAEYTPRSGHPLGHIIQRVYPLYAERLLRANAVDFDDLLLHVANCCAAVPETRSTLDARYRYILVDEYQDTNLAQYSIVRALSIDHPNLAVTGDPDQSIYGWRGANLKNILDFEQDFAEVRVVKLERNYRSTKAILRAADALIGHNRRRKQKSLYTENAEGPPSRSSPTSAEQDEAELIAERMADDIRAGKRRPRDFAIFYRVNALSRSLEFALRQHGIPYQMVNGLEFYQRKEIKDVLAYLRLINNPRDDNALLRIINTPARSIGKRTIDRLLAHARDDRIAAVRSGPRERLDRLARQAGGRGRRPFRRHDRPLDARRRRRRSRRFSATCSPSRATARCWKSPKTKKTRSDWPTSKNCSPPPVSSTNACRSRTAWKVFWKRRRSSPTSTPGMPTPTA